MVKHCTSFFAGEKCDVFTTLPSLQQWFIAFQTVIISIQINLLYFSALQRYVTVDAMAASPVTKQWLDVSALHIMDFEGYCCGLHTWVFNTADNGLRHFEVQP
jgi:hypothetical protein